MAAKSKTEWCVNEGRASWHQQRAGHSYAAVICFATKREALAYVRGASKHDPYTVRAIQRKQKKEPKP